MVTEVLWVNKFHIERFRMFVAFLVFFVVYFLLYYCFYELFVKFSFVDTIIFQALPALMCAFIVVFPMLQRWFLYLSRRFKKNKLKVAIASNALYVDDEFFSFLNHVDVKFLKFGELDSLYVVTTLAGVGWRKNGMPFSFIFLPHIVNLDEVKLCFELRGRSKEANQGSRES